MKNIDKYKNDLDELITLGDGLHLSIQYECFTEEFKKQAKGEYKENYDDFISNILDFKKYYQSWYSESLVLLKQLLPDRVNDFIKLYEKPKTRKEIDYGNYVIEDYLQNLVVSFRGEQKVGPRAAINQYVSQLNILKSIKRRFESSLFDIRQITQADIFDSELDSAKELNKNGFGRGAGAISGVVLEKHLSQVCENHKIKIAKKNPSISDFNDRLKNQDVYDTPTWRKIQHLGDLRNICDHNKDKEPSKEDVDELIDGVDRVIKTIF